MTISYKWLLTYLPMPIEAEQLSAVLTSVGLEVESLEKYESVKGGLKGLVVGEVVECAQHPQADKLKVARVDIGGGELLQIVCGAANVARGQKVIVARPGTTIYPIKGDPLTLKVATIRGVESYGMICAEDEIGLGEDHAGILVLSGGVRTGTPAADSFRLYEDLIFEIGLTPNHMDAMSHWGVAREVCAYLSHHENKNYSPRAPAMDFFKPDRLDRPMAVRIVNQQACRRYSGVTISGILIGQSPPWMQERLKAIGVRPINNIVDITNFVLHETGQPLHAFDADEINDQQIIIRNLPAGTKFTTLDDKQRVLSSEDLMICDVQEGICMAGVFGGLKSGVKTGTRNIFLESAWFDPAVIRKTSFRHGLRTEAATHFEKGMDISNTVNALKRAAWLIKEHAAGEISSEIIDVYPEPGAKNQIVLTYAYLKKLSGKSYPPDAAKQILESLGFEILDETSDQIRLAVPYHKPDVVQSADLVEEIMRIDGLDNVAIPSVITISPSAEAGFITAAFKEKVANYLVGLGFHEIFTNSITNSAYYDTEELEGSVKMLNNLSAELNVMRPSLLETGLESISYNLNRKAKDLKFFEFGKTYRTTGTGHYTETNHLCLYVTGKTGDDSWKGKADPADLFYLKGVCQQVARQISVENVVFYLAKSSKLGLALQGRVGHRDLLQAGSVSEATLGSFDIRQPVYFADFSWDLLSGLGDHKGIELAELPRQLPVHRDLAMIVSKHLPYEEVEKSISKIKMVKLRQVRLFDIFENEKLGADKKSLAVSLTFLDDEKTLTDKEVDGMTGQIMEVLEKELSAEIRK